MKIKSLFAILLAFGLVACDNTQAKTAIQIKNELEKTYADKNVKVLSVTKSPVKGLYEVVFEGNQLLYIDEQGQYIIEGEILDIKGKKNITAERMKVLNKIDASKLNVEDAIKEVRGNGKNIVYVFNDPDCPFCHKLELEFAKMTDITIYTFLMPIDSLHPKAREHAQQIWCQPERTKVWNAYMRENKPIPKVDFCDNPVERNIKLGYSFGFHGTPTLVFPNGTIASGWLPAATLQEAIAKNQ